MKKSNIRNLLFAVLLISVFVVMASFVSAAIFINEFLPNSVNTDYEWIELFNNGPLSINISNYNISEEGATENFTLSNVIIPPNGFAVLVRNEAVFNETYNLNGVTLVEYGTLVPSLNLNNADDSIFLYNSSGEIIDSIINYADPGENISIGRNPDGSDTITIFAFLSPGSKNDKEAPILNKWIRPSANNTVVRGSFNVTVNITDAVNNVDTCLINFNNINSTMSKSDDLCYFIWNTKLNSDGLYNITIFFNDTLGFSNTDTLFDIRINNSNLAPNISSLPKTTAFVNEIYNYDVEAIDPNGDPLNFSLTQNPTGMTIDSDTGLITFIPSSLGIFGVNVSVSDGNLTDSQSYNLEIVKGPKLRINDLDVKVDGKTDKNLKDGDKIDEEAKPGSRVQFDLEIENLFTRDEDLEIKDIEVDITIEDIDDGDDLDEESDEFDLEAGDDENVEIVFNIPLDVDEDDYDVLIKVKGQDENGTSHEISLRLILEVEKEDHEIRIIRTAVTPPTVSCDRSIAINAEIINSGSSDEEDVALEILSSELGINSFRNGIDLEEGTNDNMFSEAIRSTIDSDEHPGSYPIVIKSYYDGKLSETETVYLNIEKCEQRVVSEDLKPESATVQVIKPSTIIKDKPSQAKFSILESNGYITLIAILVVIFIGMIIFILGAAFYVLKR